MTLPEQPEASRLSILALTTPVAMGYVPLGSVFGFLFVQAGAEWWLAVLASLCVYAGAAQFMMIPMLAAGLPVGAIALATLIVNLRHVFYGLSLPERMPNQRLLRWYLIFALTDETYSLLTSLPKTVGHRQMAGIALLNQGWWLLGTLLGALIGASAKLPLAGLDFALAALFAVLTVEQWRARRDAFPIWVALLAYGIAQLLAPQQALLIAIVLSILVGLWRKPASAELSGEAKP